MMLCSARGRDICTPQKLRTGRIVCRYCGRTLGETVLSPALRTEPMFTERTAASRIADHVSGQRGRILAEIRRRPSCAGQIAPLVGLSPNQTAARIGELRADGLIRWQGSTPCAACSGRGRWANRRCDVCSGAGGTGGNVEATPSGGDGMVWETR